MQPTPGNGPQLLPGRTYSAIFALSNWRRRSQEAVLKPVLPTQPHLARSSGVGHSLQLMATTLFVWVPSVPSSPGTSSSTSSLAKVAWASPSNSAALIELSRPRPPTTTIGTLRALASEGAHHGLIPETCAKSRSGIRETASSRTFLTLERRSYQFDSTTMASMGSSTSVHPWNSWLRKVNNLWAIFTSASVGTGALQGSSPQFLG